MIVKKMPILQGFPDFETVKFFTGKFFQKYNFSPVFYDIETTGLSRKTTYLYLVGAVGIEDKTWTFYQWMAENDKEEETILRIFSQFLEQYDCLISYNGERFDQPYLEARYEKYGLPSPFEGKISLDLYLTLKPLKTLLKLPAMKQPCLEEFLGIKNRIYDNGKECIQLYKDFLKKRDHVIADEVLGHNLEDVLGLVGRDALVALCFEEVVHILAKLRKAVTLLQCGQQLVVELLEHLRLRVAADRKGEGAVLGGDLIEPRGGYRDALFEVRDRFFKGHVLAAEKCGELIHPQPPAPQDRRRA